MKELRTSCSRRRGIIRFSFFSFSFVLRAPEHAVRSTNGIYEDRTKILSPQHERWKKVMLWMGIVCLIFSTALIPYTINNIRKTEKKLTETQFNLSPKIETTTKREARLKELLIKSLATNEKLWQKHEGLTLEYIAERAFRSIALLFIFGWFLVVSYYRSRIYTRLIRKLQKS